MCRIIAVVLPQQCGFYRRTVKDRMHFRPEPRRIAHRADIPRNRTIFPQPLLTGGEKRKAET